MLRWKLSPILPKFVWAIDDNEYETTYTKEPKLESITIGTIKYCYNIIEWANN